MSLFTERELRSLRNDIPINRVIIALGIPTKLRDGHLRFLCPICGEFHTATKATTNLARCFRCKKNFNPIDITMVSARCNFKTAVHGLMRLLAKTRGPPPPHRA